MDILGAIRTKKHGGKLTHAQYKQLVEGICDDSIPDYQLSALLMAIWFSGMDAQETGWLTMAMADSGDRLNFKSLGRKTVDKHSTGGVADTTTLIAAPLAAACGAAVVKLSGRGLGHTGGTLDKLEAVPGVRIEQSPQEMEEIVRRCSMVVAGQSKQLAPADKKLYALRDVTETVDSIPLIAASIMSKKLAGGCDAITLDVKVGSGAFMKTEEEAVKLAQAMVDLGKEAGVSTVAVVSSMEQPLGRLIGNALEVKEALEILRGQHLDEDLAQLSIAIAAQMVYAAGNAASLDEAEKMVRKALADGLGEKKLLEVLSAEGGDVSVLSDLDEYCRVKKVLELTVPADGWVSEFDTEAIGNAARLLGAGRLKLTDKIDPKVGLEMLVRLADGVTAGQPWIRLYINDEAGVSEAAGLLENAITISKKPVERQNVIKRVVY